MLDDPLNKWLSGEGLLENPSEAEFADAGRDLNHVVQRRLEKKIEATIEPWGETARAYVMEPRESKAREGETIAWEMHKHYKLALCIRDLLSTIADQNPPTAPGIATERIYRLPYSVELLSTLSLRMARKNDSPGVVKERSRGAVIEPAEPLERFLYAVDLSRIKRCAYENCKRIFWAGRYDRPCCSDMCRNAYKQKKHRDRKRANRRYKEFLKKRSTPK